MSSTFGHLFRVTNFGESHGPAIGCVIDGCPPGMPLAEADLQHDLDRRKPGTSRHVTQRRESDRVEILSGVYEGQTTGTPIALLIRNEDSKRARLRGSDRYVSPGPRRLHLLAQVRVARSARRWAILGPPDRANGRCGRRRQEMAAREVRHPGARIHAAARRNRDSVCQLGRGRDQSVLRAEFAAGRTAGRAMDELRKSGDSVGARLRVVATHVPVGLGCTAGCKARCRHRARDDGNQRRQRG